MSPKGETLQEGQLLAQRFRLQRFLDEGGLGQVWLAQDTHLDNAPVALKVLKEELAETPAAITDLKREVLLTRRLRHPNILAVYTFWEAAPHALITMEYIQGKNLTQALGQRKTAFSLETLLPWLKKIADALDYAHDQGVLHRDIKPGNIMISDKGELRLADFGIARTLLELETRNPGEFTCGTLSYMSPEQILGTSYSAQSDQYSLATTCYELLSGKPPFHGDQVLIKIQYDPVPPIEHSNDAINMVFQRALAKKPEQRFTTCNDFYNALQAASESLRTKEEPPPIEPVAESAHKDTVRIRKPDINMMHMRLGMILLKEHVLTPDQLETALEIQNTSSHRLGAILVNENICTEEAIAKALSCQLNLPYSALTGEPMEPEITRMLTVRLAVDRQCIPLRQDGESIVVAMADPLDLNTINELESTFDAPVTVLVATPTALHQAASRIYGAS